MATKQTNAKIDTILLVENDQSTLNALYYFLRRSGYEVIGASSVAEADWLMGVLGSANIAAVISDINLTSGKQEHEGYAFYRRWVSKDPDLAFILISGDLDQSIGAPIKRGEVLFEIAPLDSYRVIVEVDERDIEQIKVSQQGKLVLNSLPEMYFPFVIEKITPVSTTNEGRNYFVTEARLLESSTRLRPGMQGYGKIFIERRKLIWIWTHGLIDWFRLWAWGWIP